MDNQKPSQLYFAFDGDNVGQRHAQAILSDDPDQISSISAEITHANEMVRDFVESNGGQMVSFGGDEGIFSAPAEFLDLLDQLRKDYEYMVGATLSVGYGSKPSEAGKALLYAKEHGKNQAIPYDENMESGIANQQEDVDGDSENNTEPHQESQGGYANEVASDGITRDDPPSYDNNRGYDSGYKDSSKEDRGDSYRADDLTPPVIAKPNLTPKMPVMEATSGDVPETSRPMNNIPSNPGEQEPEDKKPTSKYYDGQAEWIKPDQDENGAPQSMADATNENRPSDLKYMDHSQKEQQADMPIEDSTTDAAEDAMAAETGTEGTANETPIESEGQHCPSCTCDAHEQTGSDQPIEEVLDQHIDNASDYTNTIGEGGDGGNQSSAGDQTSGDGDSIENILDQHLDNAADMAQNGDVNSEGMDPNGISRPEDYNAKQGDMGLSEEDAENDDPNLDEVLRDGLDSHADSIQREKVIDMVGQALDAFKGQKQILDKAKEQAPELYSSCISMLRAMIELCSLAGIDQSQPEQEVNEIEGQEQGPEEAPGEEGQSQAPCPNCGHGKEKPAAPQGKEQSADGSAIGSPKKLPSGHPTPHIAKEPLPEGGINAKGQKKITNPETGKISTIDMKVGRVKGPQGTPVKG